MSNITAVTEHDDVTWISVKDRYPENGQAVEYRMYSGGHVFGGDGWYELKDGYHVFYGPSGWLANEDVYWRPRSEDE